MTYFYIIALLFCIFHVFMTIKNYFYISAVNKKTERIKYGHR